MSSKEIEGSQSEWLSYVNTMRLGPAAGRGARHVAVMELRRLLTLCDIALCSHHQSSIVIIKRRFISSEILHTFKAENLKLQFSDQN